MLFFIINLGFMALCCLGQQQYMGYQNYYPGNGGNVMYNYQFPQQPQQQQQWRPPMQYYPQYSYPQYNYPQQQQYQPYWNPKPQRIGDFKPAKIGFQQQQYNGYYNQNNGYYNQNNGYYDPYNGYYGQDQRYIPEVRPDCNPIQCYRRCRLKILGGGRCTNAGCVCYAGFFDHDGSPLNRVYPEDDLWYQLPKNDQDMIRREILNFRKENQPATSRPDFNNNNNNNPGGGGWNRPTQRPTQRPTARPPYNPPTARPPYNPPTARPPYNPATARPPYIAPTTSKPNYDNGNNFWGGNDEGSGGPDDYYGDDDDDDWFGRR